MGRTENREQKDTHQGPGASPDRLRTSRERCAKKSKTVQKTFALSADVSEAHRQVPVAECDWYLLGCQIQPVSVESVNKVGAFRVASASYYWSRVASAKGRLAQYLVGHASLTWHMVVADDFLLEASGPFYRAALVIFFLLCSSLNVSLSWNKTAWGRHSHLGWVRAASPQQPKLGISERRTEWLTRWADSTYIQMSKFEECLGRIVYVAGALEFERPFLGPLCKFLHDPSPRLSASSAVSRDFHPEVLVPPGRASRHYPCALELVI